MPQILTRVFIIDFRYTIDAIFAPTASIVNRKSYIATRGFQPRTFFTRRIAAIFRRMDLTPRTIFFDYNATTPLDLAVRAAMLPFLGEIWGNPSSVHHVGIGGHLRFKRFGLSGGFPQAFARDGRLGPAFPGKFTRAFFSGARFDSGGGGSGGTGAAGNCSAGITRKITRRFPVNGMRAL
jgi:uncharacterized membrane protein YgcG